MSTFLKNNALTLALFTLFALSIVGQAISGWYASLESEFFSLATLLLLSVYLRQKGSSQSKPVDANDDHTGD